MNRVYSIVWNRALHSVQVASELASSAGSGNRACASGTYAPRRHLLALACVAALALGAFALPAWSATCTVNGIAYTNCTVATSGGPGLPPNLSTGMGGAGGYGSSSNHGGQGGDSSNGANGFFNGHAGQGTNGSGGGGGNAYNGAAGGTGGLGAGNGIGGGGNGNTAPGSGAGGGFGDAGVGGGGGGGGAYFAEGGGGGGGGALGATVSGTYSLESGHAVVGGAGGAGGLGIANPTVTKSIAEGGAGGGGGAGMLVNSGTFTNRGAVSGGAGGTGGQGQAAQSGVGVPDAPSGGGGAGVLLASRTTLVNTGAIFGGAGGNGGVGVASEGSSIITTDGIISGGLSGNGTHADAIDLAGGNNQLTLEVGATVTGNIVASGSDNTLTLGDDTLGATTGGSATLASDLSGFSSYRKTGTGAWTLTGTSTGAAPWTIAQGTLNAGGANVFGTGTVTMDAGTVLGFAADKLTLANAFVLNGDPTVTLTGGQTETLSGPISDGTTPGELELDGDGTGTLTLDGTNAYTGLTEVTAGTLLVGDSTHTTASIAGDTQVDSGATLGGFGTVGAGSATSTTQIQTGGVLSPGAGTGSIGTLNVGGNLTLDQGSVLDVDLGAPGTPNAFTNAGASDSVNVAGTLTFNGGSTLNLAEAGGMGRGLYNLASYGSLTTSGCSFSGGAACMTLGTLPSGTQASYYTIVNNANVSGTGGQIDLYNTGGQALNIWAPNGPADLGGTGTWSATSATWTDTNGDGPSPMLPSPGFAIFQDTLGTVTLSGVVSSIGLQFAVNGYTLSGDGTSLLQLVSDAAGNVPVVEVGDGSSASANMTVTVAALMGAEDGFVKTGAGTFVIAGGFNIMGTSNPVGAVVQAGTLQVGTVAAPGSAEFVGTAVMSPGTDLALANGSIAYYGTTAGSATVSGSDFNLTTATTGTNTSVIVGAALPASAGAPLVAGAGAAINADGFTATFAGNTIIAGAGGYGGSYGGTGAAAIRGTGFTVVNNSTIGAFNPGGAGAPTVHYGITGGTGGYAGGAAIAGGAGIEGTGFTVRNSGGIYGGVGVNYGGGLAGTAGGAGIGGTGFTLTNSGMITGGVGGNAATDEQGHAGVGGTGVNGSAFTATNTGTITGGAGGDLAGAGYGATNGTGGAGVSGAGFTITNSGTITGGAGGQMLGLSAGEAVTNGIGGVGVSSTGGATVINEGTISGGLSTDGTAQADAIEFTGGGNTLELVAGHPGTFNGAVVVERAAGDAADTLELGGDSGSDTFDVSKLASGGEFSGFNAEAKSGGSTWTLTGAGSTNENWTIAGGTLAGDTTALQGNLTFAPAQGDSASVVFNQGSGNANSTPDGTFAGVIAGNGNVTKDGDGTLTLTGANTFTGGVAVDGGTLAVSADANLGAAAGALTFNGGTLENTAAFTTARGITLTGAGTLQTDANLTAVGVIGGAGALIKTGGATLALTGANTFAGGTTISAGTVSVGNSAALGTGKVSMAAGTTLGFAIDGLSLANAFALSGDPTFDVASANQTDTVSGVIADGTAPGALEKTGAGTLVLTGANTWSAGTIISAGTLQVGNGGTSGAIGTGAITDNGTLVFDRSDAVALPAGLTGNGALIQQGAGGFTVNGDDSGFAGTTTIKAGTATIGDDSHASASLGGMVDVAKGATIQGIGTVGGMDVSGTLSPGGSIGTLHVAGDATFEAGSTFNVEADPNGKADQLAVGGKTTIKGGNVLVLAEPGNWAPKTAYAIITAGEGVSGKFDEVSDNQAFLTPTLAYGANDVTLTLQRNDINFGTVAQSPNQKGVADGIESLGFGNALYDAVVKLDATDAQDAFNQTSGEYHASEQTARIDDSRYVREAMNQRLRQGDNDPEATRVGHLTAWAHAWGHWGSVDGDGNAAQLSDNGDGLLIGADMPVGTQGRVGITGGASRNTLSVRDRSSWGRDTSTWLGAFAGFDIHAFSLRGGVAYAWDQIPTNRQIAFPGYADRLSDNATGSTLTGFVEGAWTFHFTRGTASPFLNLAHTRLVTGASTEQGGAAALRAYASGENVSFGTLGARGQIDFAQHLNLHGELGWQHAFGDTTPTRTLAFAAGGAAFTEYGVPIAKNAGLGRIGIGWHRGNVAIDANYEGLAGGGTQDQAAKVSVSVRF